MDPVMFWACIYFAGFLLALLWITFGPGKRLFGEEPGEEGDVIGGVFVFLWPIMLPIDVFQWARGK